MGLFGAFHVPLVLCGSVARQIPIDDILFRSREFEAESPLQGSIRTADLSTPRLQMVPGSTAD